MTSTTLDALYRRCSARLSAHAAARLAAAGADPLADADDATQQVWLWAAQQCRLPDWDGLRVMTDWVIDDALAEQRARPEVLVGVRLAGQQVKPLTGLSDVARPWRGGRADAAMARLAS